MSERRHPNVLNVADADPISFGNGARFGGERRLLGFGTGARRIGASWFELPPGKAAFPFHYHCANEESLLVLEGTGTLRIGDQSVIVGAGDYATFPPGPGGSHQLTNTSDAPLRYLCLSTLDPVEVVGYPDSGKVLAMGAPKPYADAPWVRVIGPDHSTREYFDGEE